MNDILTLFKQLDFLSMPWLFVIAFVIHELEEWNITEFELRNFVGVPATVTGRNARTWIGIICGVGLAWCAAATWPGNPTLAAYVFLPAVALALGNALQHVFWTLYFRQYAPGVISASVLLLPLGGYLVARAVQQGYVAPAYAAVLIVLMVFPPVQAVRAGNEMTAPVRGVYRLGNWLAEKLRERSVQRA
jgi:hypothetical protein